MSPDPDELAIETERIRSVFQQASLTLLVAVLNAVLTAAALATGVNHELLSVWVILVATVAGVRWAVRRTFVRRRPEGVQCRPWAAVSVFGSLAMGVLWGIGASVLFPASETRELFLAFVIGGMCAGTTAVNSAHMPTVLAFIAPASLPLAARFLAEGSMPHRISGLMILIFALALSLTSLRAHRAFGERIRLQLAMGRQGRELSEAYKRLQQEVMERKKAEAILHQAQKMEAIGHLTGGIAHDFNNLLHIVSGNLNLIQRLAADNALIINYVQAAEQAVKRGAQLTASLLAFARRQTLLAQRVNLNTLLQEFHQILLQAIGPRIQLRIILKPDLLLCRADPAQFQSAILNLVINARDAMPEGGQLSITTDVATLKEEDLLANPDAKPGQFACVSVQDNGSGISEEVQTRVFEPFFTTKEVGRGSGLGLSQVYGFVHQSGGDVWLHSKPGTGTCVKLFLPAADA